MARRPEHVGPPELFYNAEEARKYTENSRMIEIQQKMTERCIELLNLGEGPHYLLDVGCGSGLSGQELTAHGHIWVGIDISRDMLEVAVEREVEGDLFHQDMGQGVGFRPGAFDGVVSVSALQWLCNADKKWHDPRKRLRCFFTRLYSAMSHGARAVFQFYPENPDQMQLIVTYAMKAGFTGGMVVDFPNSTRAKKVFLCLFAGTVGPLPQGKTGEEESDGHGVGYTVAQRFRKKGGKRPDVKSREWVLNKKERKRRQGKGAVRPNTKYTGRKRKQAF